MSVFIKALLIVLMLGFSNPNTPRHPDISLPCGRTYIVQTGDTLAKIAKRCQTTVGELVRNNPGLKNPDLIYTGTALELPEPEMVTHRDEAVHEGPEPVAADETEAVYVVQLGDTLAKIARRYGRPVGDLVLANPQIKNPAVIFVGDPIRIPSQQALEQAIQQQQAEIVNRVAHNGERWIDVDLATQRVRAYEGAELIREFLASTGRVNTPTVTGAYRIWVKFLTDDMRGPGYYLEEVPYVMYFHKGYGLHGTYWHNNFGTPMSHGCVNLSTEDAAWLYDFAEVGTLVNVH